MAQRIALLALLALLINTVAAVPLNKFYAPSAEEVAITEYIHGTYETGRSNMCNQIVFAEWGYNNDINNPAMKEAALQAHLRSAEYNKNEWETHFKDVQWETFENPNIQNLVVEMDAALDSFNLVENNKEISTMTQIYGTARICPYTNQYCNITTEGIRLEPDIEKIISKSRDYEELKYVWSQWRDVSGAKMRTNYQNYVNLSNQDAKANGFADMGKWWRAGFETYHFQENIQRLWEEVKPLYNRLHAYTLKKLKGFYGSAIPDKPLIPAHILGNMWANSWENIYEILEPFPNATKVDITKAMLDKGYDVHRMFEVANEFYTSMGLESMEMSYGDLAMIEQPDDRDIVCHASAWDFCDGKDYRISMCTNVDENNLITIHHELGHIQYFILYNKQPINFRSGANPGFHEAIGDVISLSVQNPQHYQTIGLLENYTDIYENSINTLLRFALQKVAFLPFSVLVDSWRWEVFSGQTEEADWNKRWWELRESLQMVSAPVERTEDHFDPGAMYHVPSNSEFISYFVAHILQFQIYRALCIEAGQYDLNNPSVKPLHTCDFYRSTDAGKVLREGLKLGSSVHWTKVLQQMTGENELSTRAMLEYFEPLFDFLEQEGDNANKDELPADVPIDQSIPIVVFAILGVVFVVTPVAYFVYNQHQNRITLRNCWHYTGING